MSILSAACVVAQSEDPHVFQGNHPKVFKDLSNPEVHGYEPANYLEAYRLLYGDEAEKKIAAMKERRKTLSGRKPVFKPRDYSKVPPHLKGYEELYRKNPREAALRWFADAKYGLFMHFGLYSLDGLGAMYQQGRSAHRADWDFDPIPVKEYEKLAAKWKIENFDAEFICDLAVSAGMKYVVITVKHCEGFHLWDYEHDAFNSMNSACTRDIMYELTEACKARGLGLIPFYEIGYEFRHPHGVEDGRIPYERITGKKEPAYAYGDDHDPRIYAEEVHRAVKDLLKYDIAGIWLDGYGITYTRAELFRLGELNDAIHGYAPYFLVSNKLGPMGTEDYASPEGFIYPPGISANYDRLMSKGKRVEVCTSLAGAWAWRAKKHFRKYESYVWSNERLWDTMKTLNTFESNLLLNVGPRWDGSIEPDQVRQLLWAGDRIRREGYPVARGPAERQKIADKTMWELDRHILRKVPREPALWKLRKAMRDSPAESDAYKDAERLLRERVDPTSEANKRIIGEWYDSHRADWFVPGKKFTAQDPGYVAETAKTGVASQDLPEYHPAPGYRERIAWWQQAKFGMFVHWGAYSHLGGLWEGEYTKQSPALMQIQNKIPIAEYAEAVKGFRPKKFDADEWLDLMEQAGMKYIVITAKHTEGFAMYDSDVSDYNVVDHTGFGRDPLAELNEACKRRGVPLGFYYSQNWDLESPDASWAGKAFNSWDYDPEKADPERYYREKCRPQMEELLTKYDPKLFWFDVPIPVFPEEYGKDLIALMRKHHPDILMNNRIYTGGYTPGTYQGDFDTTERRLPHYRMRRPFETCNTIGDWWGWTDKDTYPNAAKDLIQELVQVVGMGGNYLLNVGPKGDGTIDPRQVALLREIGAWVKVNAEAIYGAGRSVFNFHQFNWGQSTTQGNKLYFHVFAPPGSGSVLAPGIKTAVKGGYWLDTREPVKLTKVGEIDIRVTVDMAEDAAPRVFCLELQGEPEALAVRTIDSVDFDSELSLMECRISKGMNVHDLWGAWIRRAYNWTEPGQAMSWAIRVAEEGEFKIKLTYGAGLSSEGNRYELSIGGETFSGEVKTTSHAGKKILRTYTADQLAVGEHKKEESQDAEKDNLMVGVEIGTVRLQPGLYELHVTGKSWKKPGSNLMNLRAVRLIPLT
jgi:alpha-L-fucosidase